ncbi:hypothetical protein R69746_08537 [Paraburkholderia aspalathi]|nr:hypothetical protein R69746_08537 [Paraburkholderia aspalathi]CAE6875874.1 hypothetical protein R75465_08604 [Paraburkholderia aspalathi]
MQLSRRASSHPRNWCSGDWLDRTLGADVGGFPTAGLHHIVALPLKRWWFEDWFNNAHTMRALLLMNRLPTQYSKWTLKSPSLATLSKHFLYKPFSGVLSLPCRSS